MKNYLFGAIAGDIAGGFYECKFCRTKDINKVQLIKTGDSFSDDTVCTLGIADALIQHKYPSVEQFRDCLQKWCQKYPNRGYGGRFKDWITNPVPYGSYGNGSAMRVSPIGYFSDSRDECLSLAQLSAECSHNHPEGIKGAQAIALCVYSALNSATPRMDILEVLYKYYPTYATKKLDDIRPTYKFTSTCEGSVPIAILAFLESHDYEECLKLAISMGGDSDTIAAMAGSIAYAYYGEMSEELENHVISVLPEEILSLCRKFDRAVNEYVYNTSVSGQ